MTSSGFVPFVLPHALDSWAFQHQDGRRWLAETLLPQWLPSRRWFGAKARTVKRIAVEHDLPIQAGWHFMVVLVTYEDGEPDRYAVPLGCATLDHIDPTESALLAQGADGEYLHDLTFSPGFRLALLELMRARTDAGGTNAGLHGHGSAFLDGITQADTANSRLLGVEQSNSSIIFGGRLFLKLFRRLQAGINPDAEVLRYLSERQGFAQVPPFAGLIELHLGAGVTMPAGLLLGCVDNEGDAWKWALGEVSRCYATGTADEATFARIALLGRRTAEMHLAFSAAPPDDTDFAPEPLTPADFHALSENVGQRLSHIFAALRAGSVASDPLLNDVLAHETIAAQRIAALKTLHPDGAKTRHHGDYHLGQVLNVGVDWVIIDFEGEPLRPIIERREKRSPLRDVAGMLRSFHYAAHAVRAEKPETPLDLAESWSQRAQASFLNSYRATTTGAAFLPSTREGFDALLNAYVLEKALYEIDYEMNNRPAWIGIPLRGLLAVLKQ